MAHKSKTQRAKAAVTKANRRERQERDEVAAEIAAAAKAEEMANKTPEEIKREQKAAEKAAVAAAKAEAKAKEKAKEAEKPKKKHFQFVRDVRAEMKRVTWPTRQDVLQWSGVVVAALIFFGVYVFILDSGIIGPVLRALAGLGA